MNISDFPSPHIPEKLPINDIINQILVDPSFIKLCIDASSKLSEFIGYLQNLPNPNILVSALTLQESVLSSRIEGTLATIDDVVRGDTKNNIIKDDIVEIENYVKAIQFGREELKDREYLISKNLICTLHAILLTNNVRGANKTPGSFKTEQNYIQNDILGNFTPLPPYLTDEYIENLTNYMNAQDEISPLIQAAITHVQFEMIHPFKDGNGRVGRLLIPLFLFAKKMIPFPAFYISRYFSIYDTEYKRCLYDVSRSSTKDKQPWNDWISFFLNGVYNESTRHIAMSKRILALADRMQSTLNRTEHFEIIRYLFDHLRIEPKEFFKESTLPHTSVYGVLKLLAEKGFITRVGSSRKTKYIFNSLIDVLDDAKPFKNEK